MLHKIYALLAFLVAVVLAITNGGCMKTRSVFLAVTLAVLALALGGCAGMEGRTAGAIAGGVAMHALTGGASTAWQAAATIAGVGGGVYVGDKLDKK